jgi:hypothetical protein
VIEVARMHLERVGMHRHRAMRELDENLDSIPLFARVEVQQWVLVKPQLRKNPVQSRIVRIAHGCDCNGYTQRSRVSATKPAPGSSVSQVLRGALH